jgi:hypothetical protein
LTASSQIWGAVETVILAVGEKTALLHTKTKIAVGVLKTPSQVFKNKNDVWNL